MASITKTATSYPASYSTSGSIRGTKYQNAIGKGSDTSAVSGNDYCSSRNSTATITYAFSFDIPSTATIDSVACTVRGHCESTTSSGHQADCQLYSGSTAKGSLSSFTSTDDQTLTLSTGTWTRSEIDSLTLHFIIGYYGGLINGATVSVTYTYDTVTYTVTSTLTGDGTINPSGAETVESGATYILTITPTNSSDTVTVTKDGTDITSSLVAHYTETSGSAVLGTYTLSSGDFNGSGATWFSGIVGNGYDTSSTTTSNYYSSESSTNAVFTYAVGIEIPSNATVTDMYLMVNGHAESTSNSSEYMCVQLKSGSTYFSERYNFKDAGTSNTTQTISATTMPTVSELASMVVECTLGYYGGAINGATLFVEYSTGSSTVEYYTYTYTVDDEATIAVTIGGSGGGATIYMKVNGSWVAATAVYKKVNGSWVLQSDLTTVFQTGVNYVKGN